MSSKISVQVAICLKNLQLIISELSDDTNKTGATPQIWNDTLARFRIWSSNIGAHQTGQSSLDYRLRDASHIRDQILKVLVSLRQSLLDAEEILAEAAQDDETEDAAPELEEVYSSIQRLLDCLFQLSMRIRRPALRDKILGRRKDDSKDFEDFDRRHVKDKFPNASDVLVDRLTMAISKRRSNLKYFERHHRKLGKGISVGDQSGGSDLETFYSSTLATTFHEASMDAVEQATITNASGTSYAPSLFSSDSRMTIPAAPVESAGGKPFECPFCYVIITVSDRRDWAKHVFKDLEPYVCVAEDCNLPERLYKSRHEWISHLRDSHPQSLDGLQCPLCAEIPLTNLQLQQHLRRHLEDLALFILPAADTGPQNLDSENMGSDASQQESGSDVRYDNSRSSLEKSLPHAVLAERARPRPPYRSEDGDSEQEQMMDEGTGLPPRGRDVDIEIYQEGDDLILEDEKGNVIGTIDTTDMTEEQKAQAIERGRKRLWRYTSGEYIEHRNELYTEKAGDQGADVKITLRPDQPQKTFMNRFDLWKGFGRRKQDEGESGGLSKQPERKKGPAHAYQFGNTIIVEDEDGEVIKTYSLPTEGDQTQRPQYREGLRRMGTWVGLGRQVDRAGSSSSHNPADGEAGVSKDEYTDNDSTADGAAPALRTLGSGRRKSTAEFLKQMQQLEAERKKTQELGKADAPEGEDDAWVPNKIPRLSLSRHQGETPAERRRKQLDAIAHDELYEQRETAAEKRRRLAALRLTPNDDSSEDDGLTSESGNAITTAGKGRRWRFSRSKSNTSKGS